MSKPVTPTKLKIVKGTGKPSRINPAEPDPDIDIPAMPSHLTKDAIAEWKRITPILESMGLIAQMDMVAMSMYCTSWGRHIKAERMIAKGGENGEIETTSNGNVIQSPWVGMSNQSMILADKLLSKFGLSPADRTKVSAKIKTPVAPVGKDRFFK